MKRSLLLSPCSDWNFRLGGQLKLWISTAKANMDHLGFQSVFGVRN